MAQSRNRFSLGFATTLVLAGEGFYTSLLAGGFGSGLTFIPLVASSGQNNLIQLFAAILAYTSGRAIGCIGRFTVTAFSPGVSSFNL